MVDMEVEDVIEPVSVLEILSTDALRLHSTYYHIRGVQGVFSRNLSAPLTDRTTQVYASIAEIDNQDNPHLGDAVMTVHDVVPLDGQRVIVRGEVSWPAPLNVRVNMFFANQVE
ncbi:hypothetical protein RKE29_20670 [Streptomyces sp. B1866]|uniref:hypothetical protein n=1 Tax=Streptomyces sp. B1866 TaxID=3075431 RepID=UPI00288D6C07|nr:hypothetical protein [Streptomyces sp. B1866]MDT3399028.1 hypothetical protein [Streptomyces sp. B1866]